jgi:hypothetical protein
MYQSAHFTLHTDLDPEGAEEALERMEATLDFAVTCWGQPPRGRIECYLVHELDNWRDAQLPHALARILIGGVGGATLGEGDWVGRGLWGSGRHSARARGGARRSARQRQAVIFASTTAGIIEHEIMHAYCLRTFGLTGPDWYKEGMAELAFYGEREESGVRCPNVRLQVLRSGPRKSLAQVLRSGRGVERIRESLDRMLVRRGHSRQQVAMNAWTDRDTKHVAEARDDYLWSWSLCHLLHHNPTYRDRFRMVGHGYFAQRENAFAEVFSAMHAELSFEYSHFVENVQFGYRADLCRWDWNSDPRKVEAGQILSATIEAARGWQAFDVELRGGNVYAYRADGKWSTGTDQASTTADGDGAGRGRLVGVILQEYRLSAPFELGARGRFVAPESGQLYLRCQDVWHELSGNSGELSVRLALQSSVR